MGLVLGARNELGFLAFLPGPRVYFGEQFSRSFFHVVFISKGHEEGALKSLSLGNLEETLTKCIIKGADNREKGVRMA